MVYGVGFVFCAQTKATFWSNVYELHLCDLTQLTIMIRGAVLWAVGFQEQARDIVWVYNSRHMLHGQECILDVWAAKWITLEQVNQSFFFPPSQKKTAFCSLSVFDRLASTCLSISEPVICTQFNYIFCAFARMQCFGPTHCWCSIQLATILCLVSDCVNIEAQI